MEYRLKCVVPDSLDPGESWFYDEFYELGVVTTDLPSLFEMLEMLLPGSVTDTHPEITDRILIEVKHGDRPLLAYHNLL